MNSRRLDTHHKLLAVSLTLALLCVLEGMVASAAGETITLKDMKGVQHQVPQGKNPTLLLFVRIGQDQSHTTLVNAKKAMKDFPAVRVLAVVSGKHRDDVLNELAASVDCSIVKDENYDLVGRFKVRAWPSNIFLLGDGSELVRLSGLPRSHAEQLAAYAAFATGKIDRQVLQRRLAASTTVTDDPYQIAMRHLRVSQRLMEKGLLKQASRELDRGLKLLSADTKLLLARVRLQLLQADSADALTTLAKLDKNAGSAARIATLRGWAFVRMGESDKAIAELEKAVKMNPNPSEAYYLRGVSYQRKGQWPDAAKAFRSAIESSQAGRHIAIATKAKPRPAKPAVVGKPSPAQTAEPTSTTQQP